MKQKRTLPTALLLAGGMLWTAGGAAAQNDGATGKPKRPQLSLRRDIEGPDAEEAASFSFLNTVGEGTVFSADFALRADYGSRGFNPAKGTVLSVEGHLSSADSESQDVWRFRGSLTRDGALGRRGSYFSLVSLKHESDRDFKTRKLTAEVLWTPTLYGSAVGQVYPTANKAPNAALRYRVRPYLGFEVGKTLSAGGSEENEDAVLRLLGRAKVNVFLERIARVLRIDSVLLSADNTFYYLPLEDDRTHNLFVAELEFRFNEIVSFGLAYQNGEAAPNFHDIETFGGTIGVRF